jgi:hypothetical protein
MGGLALFSLRGNEFFFEKITKTIYDGGERPSKAIRRALATKVTHVYYI